MDYSVIAPQGWRGEFADIAEPEKAYEAMALVAQEAETLGYHSIWLYDHLHTIPPTQNFTFECWTSTAALARDTKHIRIGQIVTCNSYRNPALLAKMASTVDALSHGRLTVGIGAGWYKQEHYAYGYRYADTGERLRNLSEAAQVMLAMWTQEEATFSGGSYQISGAINQPKSVQKPHIPLLIGGNGEQVTLKLVARYGDACNVSGDATKVREKFAILRQHCAEVGRDYNSIRRTVIIDDCAVAETEEAACARLRPEGRDSVMKQYQTALIGTPTTLLRRLQEYEDAGVQEIIIRFVDFPDLESLRLFARDCMHARSTR